MEEDHLEILLEDIRSKVEVISEGYNMLNQKIDGVAADLVETRQELKEKIAIEVRTLHQKIDEKFGALDQKIDKVAADLDQKIDKVVVDLAAHRADTETHRGYQVAER
jgi:archaellum component FlaC